MDIPSYLMGRSAGSSSASTQVVQELPETGQSNVIYLVPKQTAGQDDVFDEYIWVNNDWELIGSTAIDISGKQDVMQFSTMPTADSTTVGKIIQYVGTTTNDYTNGYFYIGTTDGAVTPTYGWNNINVQASSGTVDTTLKFKIPQNEMQYANKPYTSVSDYNISNTTWKNAIKDFLQQMYNAGQDSFNMIFYGNNGATSKVYYNFSNYQSTAFLSTKPTQIEMYSFEPYFANNCDYNPIRLNITSIVWDGNTISSFTAKMNKFTTTPYLTKNNTDTYAPSFDYNPATKKYVDDSITTAITTTLGGSY